MNILNDKRLAIYQDLILMRDEIDGSLERSKRGRFISQALMYSSIFLLVIFVVFNAFVLTLGLFSPTLVMPVISFACCAFVGKVCISIHEANAISLKMSKESINAQLKSLEVSRLMLEESRKLRPQTN